MMRWCLIVFVMAGFPEARTNAREGERLSTQGEHPVVAEVKKLPPRKATEFIESLGTKMDFKALEALYLANIPDMDGCGSSFAAGVYCSSLDPEKAVAFCASLPLNSRAWTHAFARLRFHPKGKVIGYIQQLATSSKSSVRSYCYFVCQNASWDDLVEQAKKDFTCRDGHGMVQMPLVTLTVGDVARDYVRHCMKK